MSAIGLAKTAGAGGKFMADYVIVGAGSAGCVLAARLSEDPAAQVTLIEAGGPDDASDIHVPAAQGKLRKSDCDWDYSSQPEPHLDGRFVYLPRGKTLGGSSAINAMVYIRGCRFDYDEWAAEGAEGWSFDALLPYFRKSESNERGEDQYHGKFGPLSVCDGRSRNPLMDAFVRAGVEAGYQENADFNGASQDGVGLYQCTQRDGMRCSAATAYLHPARSRPNLNVITETLATRILFDGARARGVEIARNGDLEEIRAETEVIIAAGAYNSPQLLLLSGIGPAADMAAMGIVARHDLPVGVGLQDHVMAFMSWLTDTETLMTAATAENAALLQREGRGPLSSNCAEAGGFFRTRPGLEAPDIQFHAIPAMINDFGLSPSTDHAISFSPGVLKPQSRGKVSLRSTNPKSKPRILHNYFAVEDDRRSMIAGVRIGLELASQPALRAHITGPHNVPRSASEEDIWSFVQRNAQTLYHPTSTCAIGPVVDSNLKVHGVESLRIVDASVMPSIVRGNTNAPTVAIAERAADLIRGLRGA
jgi:choline dehydrogenase-like flavoprotein